MIETISSRWWLLLLRGITGIVVGVIAFTQPGIALIGLVLVLGFYTFIVGALALTLAVTGVAGDRWWALLIEGIIGIVAACLIWSWPLASAVGFVYFVASWLILSGVMQVIAGVRLRDFIDDEWIYILGGIVSIAFGVWVFRSPGQGAVATAFLFGWYFLFIGILQALVAFRLRSLNATVTKTAKPA